MDKTYSPREYSGQPHPCHFGNPSNYPREQFELRVTGSRALDLHDISLVEIIANLLPLDRQEELLPPDETQHTL